MGGDIVTKDVEVRKMQIRRKYRSLILFTICLVAIQVGMAKRANGQNVPEEIIIDKGGYGTDIYEGVRFNHITHAFGFEIACKVCHHAWNPEEKNVPGKCNDCHLMKDMEKVSLRDAYMNLCRGCHGKLKIEGKPSGPTRCNECHSKKKRMR